MVHATEVGCILRGKPPYPSPPNNVNPSTPRTWYFAEEGPWVEKPSGHGPRLILVHAVTTDGWVEGAQLVFQAKQRTGDYHGQMNFANFRKWFPESLLPHIPVASLIMMDNAPYHNVYVDGAFYPTSSTPKSALQQWLQQHHPAAYQPTMIRGCLSILTLRETVSRGDVTRSLRQDATEYKSHPRPGPHRSQPCQD